MVRWSRVTPVSRVTEEGVKLHRQSKGEQDECKGVEKVMSGRV